MFLLGAGATHCGRVHRRGRSRSRVLDIACGMKRRGLANRPDKRDPIAMARDNWERSGWGDVADGMVAVTSVMRAHQILLARVENALRPYDLSFSRYELLRLLAFSRTGALPITKASDRLQVHVTSVTHAIRRLEADGLVERIPHPTDGRTTLVQITDLGRSTVEDATVTLNRRGVRRYRNVRRRVTRARRLDRDAAPQLRRLLARHAVSSPRRAAGSSPSPPFPSPAVTGCSACRRRSRRVRPSTAGRSRPSRRCPADARRCRNRLRRRRFRVGRCRCRRRTSGVRSWRWRA